MNVPFVKRLGHISGGQIDTSKILSEKYPMGQKNVANSVSEGPETEPDFFLSPREGGFRLTVTLALQVGRVFFGKEEKPGGTKPLVITT